MRAARLFVVVAADWRYLVRDKASRTIFAVLAICLTLAVWNGVSIVRDHRGGLARLAADTISRQDAADKPVPIPAVRGGAILPDGPLSGLSLGRTRIDPASGEFTIASRADMLFRNYQIANPAVLAGGTFDLGFVVIVIAPLFLIALGHGVLASDRDAGRLRLMLASGIRPAEIALGRLFVRTSLIAGMIAGTALIGTLAVGSGPGAWCPLFAWIAVSWLYLLLWCGIVTIAASYAARAQTIAVGLLALWGISTLLLPAIAAWSADLIDPAPSRTAFDADIRRAQTTVLTHFERYEPRVATAAYRASPAPPYLKRGLVARRVIDDAFLNRARSFDRAAARRRDIIEVSGVFVPALGFDQLLTTIAGTDDRRYMSFRRAASDWAIDTQRRLTDRIWTSITVPPKEARIRHIFELGPGPASPGPIIAALLLLGACVAFGYRRLVGVDA